MRRPKLVARVQLSLSDSAARMPTDFSMQGNHKVEVIINGASVLESMAEPIRNLVVGEIGKALDHYVQKNLPDLPRPEPGTKASTDEAMKWIGQGNKLVKR